MPGKTHGTNSRMPIVGTILAIAVMAMIISGCNTIEGVGKDVSAAGQTVADWAGDDESGN